jgi:hypothetical protein
MRVFGLDLVSPCTCDVANGEGEDGCHSKLVLLFDTLHRNAGLCRLVRKLGKSGASIRSHG